MVTFSRAGENRHFLGASRNDALWEKRQEGALRSQENLRIARFQAPEVRSHPSEPSFTCLDRQDRDEFHLSVSVVGPIGSGSRVPRSYSRRETTVAAIGALTSADPSWTEQRMITREELVRLIWAMPLTKASEQPGISYSKLVQICAALGVPRAAEQLGEH